MTVEMVGPCKRESQNIRTLVFTHNLKGPHVIAGNICDKGQKESLSLRNLDRKIMINKNYKDVSFNETM